MTEGDVAAVLRDGLVVTLKLAGPPLVIGLVVGALVSLLQAVTQLHEATLAFVPKALALALALALAGPFMFATLQGYAHRIADHIVAVGGS
ncbi:MAG TPA: flagellar biosynthetic protein FliQ [Acetobacteraceae bacterium]|nr:flagellar biosynthetic protein FliQ [Acetobacteraceae bacterium]